MTCSACANLDEGEENCPVCKGTGEIVIADRCPLQIISPEAWQMLDFAEWMEDRFPPVLGGVLNQTASFMQSLNFIRRAQAHIEAENRARE